MQKIGQSEGRRFDRRNIGEEKRGKEVRAKRKRNVDLTVPRVYSFTRSHFCDGGPADRHKESVSRLKIRGARRQVDVERS